MFTIELLGLAIALLASMVIASITGRWIAGRVVAAGNVSAGSAGLGVVEGAVFALLGLVLALTFSHSLSRFDLRRDLAATEANALGTAWQRLELIEGEQQQVLRAGLRDWLDMRLATYRNPAQSAAAAAAAKMQDRLRGALWSGANAASAGSQATQILLLPALNAVFDSASARDVAANSHPPMVVYALMFGLSLVCALGTGYGMAKDRDFDWMRALMFATVSALAAYVILDMEYPRDGLVRIVGVDEILAQLRASMQ